MNEQAAQEQRAGHDRFWLRLNWFIVFVGAYGSTVNYCSLYGLQLAPKEHLVTMIYCSGFASVFYLVTTLCRWGALRHASLKQTRLLLSFICAFILTLLAVNQMVLNLLGVTIDDPFTLTGLFSGVDFLAKWSNAVSVRNYFYGVLLFGLLWGGQYLLNSVLQREAEKQEKRVSSKVGLFFLCLLALAFFLIPKQYATKFFFRALPFAQLLESMAPSTTTRYLKKVQVKEEPEGIVLKKTPHLVFLLVESWRYDTVTPELMPKLHGLIAQGACYDSQMHVSGSHVTNLGAFTTLYAMDSLYYFTQVKNKKSWALKALQENNYETIGVINSVINSSFRRNFDAFYNFTKHQPFWQGDRDVLKQLETSFAGLSESKSFFGFGFLFSNHHNYYYPKKFEVFTPVSAEDYDHFAGDDKLEKHKEKIFNRYKNSLLYSDELIANFMVSMRAHAQARNEEIAFVITGDHGEEFWDTGPFLGHGASTMVDHRVRVPLVTCGIPIENKRLTHTSNAMIWPTVMDWLSEGAIDFRRYPQIPSSFLQESPNTVASYSLRYPRNASMFAVYHGDKKFSGKLFYQQKRAELLKINDNDLTTIIPEEQLFWNKFSNEMIQNLMELERDALAP